MMGLGKGGLRLQIWPFLGINSLDFWGAFPFVSLDVILCDFSGGLPGSCNCLLKPLRAGSWLVPTLMSSDLYSIKCIYEYKLIDTRYTVYVT